MTRRHTPPPSSPSPSPQGGIPDGLLIGLIAFLLSLTVLVYTSTGLSALFAHGSWPTGITYAGTPDAIRALASQPHNLPAAWPATPPAELSGYGLFWGLFIGQLMVLVVLTIFVLGTLARWRALRRHRATTPADPPAPHEPVYEAPPAPTPPPFTPPQAPSPPPAVPAPAASSSSPTSPTSLTPLHYGSAETRLALARTAVQDAEGAVLVVTSSPALWAATKDARAKLGPVLLYDPGHLCDSPDRLHWSPTTGCEDPATAQARARALLAPTRPRARIDEATADTAETLLRCWLHAAAVDGRPFRQLHRWAQNSGAHEPVRILRTHPKAAHGHAGLLEAALTAHPERRDAALALTARTLAALSTVHIREACTPNRTDTLALDSFASEGGSLYVVGEAIEDGRTRPGAMPLLTALVADVVEHGRRMAARSSDGRLDPPLTLVLDDIAAVAPLPDLPQLLAAGTTIGLPTTALLRSPEQARDRWPDGRLDGLPREGPAPAAFRHP
ncbi:type IV secretory system conjugative DNA transfer family protein [Streptomyces sp. NPDC046887]|uniref:type IV secretory system conjugative DNA transfer family protein n=1 Tax=Streptomyces sp. NPDC046887 TaxID=3155472 RepID=UPI0033F9E872